MIRFIDTYALIAWLNRHDGGHDSVRSYLNGYSGSLLTTEWVLMEVADALARTETRRTVVEFLQAIREDPAYEVVGYAQDVYRAGFALFASRKDKEWPLTDCISFAVMTERRLTEALTQDKHFTQAGFRAVFA